MSPVLGEARAVAAAFLEARGRPPLAATVRAGGGDDFDEVAVALAALRGQRRELDRLRAALAVYADPDFWEAGTPEAAQAYYDQGRIARDALAGGDLAGTD
jgi:hypothetical protein